MKNKTKSHIVGTVQTSNRKFVETEATSIPSDTPHDHSFSWFGTGMSVQSGGIELVLWSCKCFPPVSKLPTFKYNFLSRVVIQNARILNFIHNIFNLSDI
jgi:hypothetical protein